MIDTWNPAKLNEKISGRDSWNPAILNEAVTDRDSWNPAILNESAGETPVVFSATITASFPEGATCTATDGTTTLTADDNPMAFSIPNEGTWAVACVANGVTFSEDVVITTNGQTETVDLTPDGETVTPTDSVPILIACAGIGDSTYTTISEVISDSTLLAEITTDNNTIAYLVRSTTFATTMTSDEDTMAAIGASNDCSDALINNSTWLSAICSSTYFREVLNFTTPDMTGASTPSGKVTVSASQSGYEGWKAFDGIIDTDHAWMSPTSSTANQWVDYEFDDPVCIKYVSITPRHGGPSNKTMIKNYKIQSSNNGSDYTDIYTGVLEDTGTTQTTTSVVINSITDYLHYRLYVEDSYSSAIGAMEIQFYGREDVE